LTSPFVEEGFDDFLVDTSHHDLVFHEPLTKVVEELDMGSGRRSGVPEARQRSGERLNVWPQWFASQRFHCCRVLEELL